MNARFPLLERRPSHRQPPQVPVIVNKVLKSTGQSLDPDARALMESRLGHDFSHVRVHTDALAAESARSVQSLAYTVGRDIVFATGQYAPQTSHGRQLLTHELVHVMQNGSPCTAESISSPTDASEVEAERIATSHEGAYQGYRFSQPASSLQRQEKEGPIIAGIPGQGSAEKPSTLPGDEQPQPMGGKDAFGKDCPDTVEIGDTKAIPAFNKTMLDAGWMTYFGLVTSMKVGPKSSYDACITEVLKQEENTCGSQGNMADYEPCSPKKYCMKVGEACGGDDLTDTKFPCSNTAFVDLHKTARPNSILEGSGKTECKVKCLQRYGCGGKEIGRFYITRNFKLGEFKDGTKKIAITTGSIQKEVASK